MSIARIKKNDTVIVTCGVDAGKTGTKEGKKARVSVKSGKAL